MKRATMLDVANRAGVSRSAVSRTFTEGASVHAATRQRILAAAKELNFQPNILARGLITRKSGFVSIITRHYDNPYEAYFTGHLTRRLQALGYRVLPILAADDGLVDEELVAASRYQVEATIVAAGSVSRMAVEMCRSLGVPTIVVGSDLVGDSIRSIHVDNEEGIRLAVAHLAARGRTRIAYLGGNSELYSEKQRRAAFKRQMAKHGLEVREIFEGDYSIASGHQVGRRWIHTDGGTQAIMCGNDAMAIGVIDALRHQRGVSVPHDIAVVGFDDIPMAAQKAYDLTTIRNPVDTAIEAICDALGDVDIRSSAPALKLVPELIVRTSA